MGKIMSIDASTTEFVVNQTTFYLTILITIGSAGAIIAQVIRGVNTRIRHSREEAEAKVNAADEAMKKYIEDKMKEVDEVKQRVDYMYWKLIDKWFDDQQIKERHGQSR